jgi:hypothetical protein
MDSLLSGFFFDVQDDLSGDSGRDPAHLGASFSAVAAHRVKGLSLFRDEKPIGFAVPDLMDLPAESVAHLLFKPVVNSIGYLHGFSVLLPVFKLFPPDQAGNRHDGARKRPAGFPFPGHPAREGASGFKDLLASHIQLFLQSCKNGLGSAEIVHVMLQGQFMDLSQKFLTIFHERFLSRD